jgi:signal transduction histidine kinase
MASTVRRRYTWSGMVLGLGAPLGLLALRWLVERPPRRRQWLAAQLASQKALYAYLTMSTTIAFGVFGRALGAREDRAIAAHAHLDRLRDEFTAIVAHDLRGPVQALSLQTELLLRHREKGGVLAPVSAIERIGRATRGIARMIDDLLDASRIEASRLSVEPLPTDLGAAAADLVERLRPTLPDRVIEVVAAGDLPPVLVDPRRLDQILTNLLQNAGKYAAPSTPIHVTIEGDHDGAAVSVSDHGPGIAPDELPHLFERFYQTERARAKRSGLGLGLYITHGLVEAHHGRITVQSVPGEGSTFRVWLPAA